MTSGHAHWDKTNLLNADEVKDRMTADVSSHASSHASNQSSEAEPPRHQRSSSSSGGVEGCCSKLRSLKQKLSLSSSEAASEKDPYKTSPRKFTSPGYQGLGSASLPRKHPLVSIQPGISSPSDYFPVFVSSNPAPSSGGLQSSKQWSRNGNIKAPSSMLHSPSEESQFSPNDDVIHQVRKNEKSRHVHATVSNNGTNNGTNNGSIRGSANDQNNLGHSAAVFNSSCFHPNPLPSSSLSSSSSSSSSSTGNMVQSCTELSRPASAAPNWRMSQAGRNNTHASNLFSASSIAASSCSTPVQLIDHYSNSGKNLSSFKLQNGDGLRYLAQSAHVTGRVPTELEENNVRPCSHAERMLHRMEMSLHRRQLCDVVLTSGGRSIPAHRVVLSAASDYFAAMFTSEVLESEQEEICIKGVEPLALLTCIKYIYTGQLDLQEDTVESVLSASCLLQLDEVSESCGRFLSKQLHPSNCIGIRQFADVQGCSQLFTNADAYVLDNFMEVVKNQEFYLLSAEDMIKLLSSDDICVTSEVTVFEALMSWAYQDDPARRKDLPRLLAHVRLPLLPAQYLADKVATCPLLREEAACQELIMESLKFHLLPERRQNMNSSRTRPRKSTVGVLYAVGGMDCSKGPASIEMYDLRKNRWQQVENMNGRRLQFGVAVLDSILYVVGGRDGLKTLNSVECFNPKTKTWTSMPSMATHRHGLGVGILEGPIYAVGGHDGWSYLSTVERWDPQARQWSHVASLSTARSTAGVAVLGNKLYAVGGRDGSSCLRSVESYDPHTNRWNLCCPMNKRRGGVGVAVCNQFIFAVGGHDAPSSNPTSSRFNSVERYDIKTDTWTTVTPISSPRDAVGVCVLGNGLYAVGGYDGQQYLSDVECYDAQTNEWSKVAPLCVGRAGACVVQLQLQP